ncbi:hypothetical protein [Pelobacter propionicus]|uniref:Uncharacterized protein n=1 Tax=Pelobacter propionicus (strain DSM 2379 / NBRC 103807 / OttBd1) TaxID=338966 RepID=A0R7U1_PELPD|nr:hypothetical protein [Pelobacter propionicus]ABL01406.1 hypothetical protein Ppro_3818 [Pelobacter propionicus DSM 2379]
MLFKIEIKKRLHGAWYNYPPLELKGLTIRQILEFIEQQDFVVKIEQGMGKTVYIVGKAETFHEYRGDNNQKATFFTVPMTLGLWNDSPLLDIVWPPFGFIDSGPESNDDKMRDEQANLQESLSILKSMERESAPTSHLKKKHAYRGLRYAA